MLNQHARESFQTSKWRAVNHDWSMRLVVGALIGQVESNGQVVIHLHGAKLPRATDDIAHNKINLGSVEGGLAWLFAERNAKRLRRVAARLLGLVPIFRKANVLGGVRSAQANAHAVIRHAQCSKNKFDKFQAALQFMRDLIFAAEQMRVVLRETTNARQAANFSRLLPAIDRSKFSQTHGQIAP